MSFVLVMAKEPVAGRVKTRLCPPCTPSQAAAVAEAALADTLSAVAACRADRRIVALDGTPGPWLPPGFEIIAQRGSGFAARLANAWADAFGGGPGPGIQIGMDTPQVTAADIDRVLGLVAPGQAVLGHALDGGWWVIGLSGSGAEPADIFDGVPMSRPSTGAWQQRRLRDLGLTVVLAAPMRDIDTADDLAAVAIEAPGTRTAAAARSLGCSLAGVG